MTPKELLEQAAETVSGDRQDDYGDATESFWRIAALWSAYKGVEITPHEVAMMMALLKISRSVTSPNKMDSYVDLAGYAALGASLAPPQGLPPMHEWRCSICGALGAARTPRDADHAKAEHVSAHTERMQP